MHIHDFALILIAFFSELVGTLSGFGSSTFFVPVATMLESFQFALAITAILHCFGNVSRIFIFKDFFQLKVFLRLALPSILLTGVGALLTTQVQVSLLQRSLGVALILVSGALFFGKKLIQRLPSRAALVLSGISGFLTGFIGTGGAIRGMALTALQIEKNAFVSLSASIDLGGDFIRLIIYLWNNFMDWSQWFYIPLLGIAAYLGSRIGKNVLSGLKQEHFERIVALFVLLSGIILVLKK